MNDEMYLTRNLNIPSPMFRHRKSVEHSKDLIFVKFKDEYWIMIENETK